MRTATLDISPELLAEFLKVLKDGPSRRFMVKENALPDDATIVDVGLWLHRAGGPFSIRLTLKSDSFADVPDNEKPSELPPVVCETIYA